MHGQHTYDPKGSKCLHIPHGVNQLLVRHTILSTHYNKIYRVTRQFESIHRKINKYIAIVTHITATGMCNLVPITAPIQDEDTKYIMKHRCTIQYITVNYNQI